LERFTRSSQSDVGIQNVTPSQCRLLKFVNQVVIDLAAQETIPFKEARAKWNQMLKAKYV